jgi:hypothetical protein
MLPAHFLTSVNSNLEGVSLEEQISGFELNLFFVRKNAHRLWERGIKNCVSFTIGHTVHSNMHIAQ